MQLLSDSRQNIKVAHPGCSKTDEYGGTLGFTVCNILALIE